MKIFLAKDAGYCFGVRDAVNLAYESAEKYGITAGFHSVNSDPEEAEKYKNKGFKFLGFSLDSIFLGDAAISALQKLKNIK